MPAPVRKFKKISADEARNIRKDHVQDGPQGAVLSKAFRDGGKYDKDTRSARFVMSSQTEDRYGDVVMTAGIKTERFEQNPVVLLFHVSRDWPVGKWDNLEKVLKGRPPRLEGDCKLLPDSGGTVPAIEQTAFMLEHDGIRANSIGFLPNWDEVELILDEDDQWKGLRFNESELLECSLCSIPANPDALMKMAQGEAVIAREFLEDILDNYAKTPAGLIVPRAEFEKKFKTTIDEIVKADKTAPKTKEAPAPELPVTDDEKAAAQFRSVEFELAKLCPPLEGMKIALEGEVSGKFAVEGGKVKHAGELAADDVVSMVVTTKLVDEKLVYEITKNYSHALKKGAAGWEHKDSTEEAADPKAQKPIVLELDTTEAVKDLNVLSALCDTVREKMSAVFGRTTTTERVEPTLEAPAATAEEIEAVKAKTAALRARHAEKVLV